MTAKTATKNAAETYRAFCPKTRKHVRLNAGKFPGLISFVPANLAELPPRNVIDVEDKSGVACLRMPPRMSGKDLEVAAELVGYLGDGDRFVSWWYQAYMCHGGKLAGFSRDLWMEVQVHREKEDLKKFETYPRAYSPELDRDEQCSEPEDFDVFLTETAPQAGEPIRSTLDFAKGRFFWFQVHTPDQLEDVKRLTKQLIEWTGDVHHGIALYAACVYAPIPRGIKGREELRKIAHQTIETITSQGEQPEGDTFVYPIPRELSEYEGAHLEGLGDHFDLYSWFGGTVLHVSRDTGKVYAIEQEEQFTPPLAVRLEKQKRQEPFNPETLFSGEQDVPPSLEDSRVDLTPSPSCENVTDSTEDASGEEYGPIEVLNRDGLSVSMVRGEGPFRLSFATLILDHDGKSILTNLEELSRTAPDGSEVRSEILRRIDADGFGVLVGTVFDAAMRSGCFGEVTQETREVNVVPLESASALIAEIAASENSPEVVLFTADKKGQSLELIDVVRKDGASWTGLHGGFLGMTGNFARVLVRYEKFHPRIHLFATVV